LPLRPLPKSDRNIAAAGGYVQDANRPAGLAAQSRKRRPKNPRAGAQAVQSRKPIQRAKMAHLIEGRVVHEFRKTFSHGRSEASEHRISCAGWRRSSLARSASEGIVVFRQVPSLALRASVEVAIPISCPLAPSHEPAVPVPARAA
jgi:hypothetical protein